MKRFVRRQLASNPVVRGTVFWLHPKVHRGIHLATSFQMVGGCFLCRLQSWAIKPILSQDSFVDRSVLPVADETATHRKVVMSATVKRQIEEITARDPEKGAALAEAIEKISRK